MRVFFVVVVVSDGTVHRVHFGSIEAFIEYLLPAKMGLKERIVDFSEIPIRDRFGLAGQFTNTCYGKWTTEKKIYIIITIGGPIFAFRGPANLRNSCAIPIFQKGR